MSVVGFDLGNDTSYISIARQGGIEVVANEFSYRHNSTLVSFQTKVRHLGENAKSQLGSNITNTVFNFRNLLGLHYDDPEAQAELKRVFVKNVKLPNNEIGIIVNYEGSERTFTPVQLTAMLLGKLKAVAETNTKSKVVDCVISVPVYFNDLQRRAVIEASQIAGLNCLRLFSETSAVALHYGIYKQDLPAETEKPRIVAFADMGQSSFKVTIGSYIKGKVTVLSTANDRNLGGRNFDELLYDFFCADFKNKYKIDIPSKPKAAIRLMQECEKLKKLMSTNVSTIPLSIECLMNEVDVRGEMNRETFEKMAAGLLQRTRDTLTRALTEAQLSKDDLHSVEIIGGNTRVPSVKQLIQDVLGREAMTTLNADEAVSRGCALMCAIISPTFRVREFEILEAQPYQIDIRYRANESAEEQTSEVFLPNSNVPSTKVLSFTRSKTFTLAAHYHNPEQVPDAADVIAHYTISGFPAGKEGEAQKVKVKARVDGNGLFSIESAHIVEEIEVVDDTPAPTPPPAAAAAAAATPSTDAPAADQATPMDTSSSPAGEAAPAEPVKKMKKKSIKTPLIVTANVPRVLSAAQVTALTEEEVQLQLNDRIERERADAKNALEEFVYEMREKLNDSYAEYAPESTRETISASLKAVEDWLYEEGEEQPKKVYLGKLEELKKLTDPIVLRFKETETRPAAIEAFQQKVMSFKKVTNLWYSKEEEYTHLPETDIKAVEQHVSEKERWLTERTVAQSKLAKSDPPAVLTEEIKAAAEALERICRPLVNQPKPKAPAPAPEAPKANPTDSKKAEETPAPNAQPAAATETKPDAMDVD